MSGARRLYLDDAPGERRGVVTLDGLPERLLIERAGDRPEHRPGARLIARVRRIEPALASAFLDVGTEPDAILPLAGLKGLSEGARITVEVLAPPRIGKGALVRYVEAGDGEPRLLTPAPDLIEHLTAFAPGESVRGGSEAREAADTAEEAVLAIEHALPGGGRVSIEPTRALTAIDVDLGAASGDPRRAAARTNIAALHASARLLRLKGLGGLVVIDLIGKGHDGEALTKAALSAFAPDEPGVSIGRVSRFGLLELALPRRSTPLVERLTGPGGASSAEAQAYRLLRRMQTQVAPGGYIEGVSPPAVHSLAAALAPHLQARIGPRFRLTADPELRPDALTLRPLDRL